MFPGSFPHPAPQRGDKHFSLFSLVSPKSYQREGQPRKTENELSHDLLTRIPWLGSGSGSGSGSKRCKECRLISDMELSMLLMRWDLSVKSEKLSLLHCCPKNICEHCDIVHSFGLQVFKIHRRQPSWIFRDGPILGESSWGDRGWTRSQSYRLSFPLGWCDFGTTLLAWVGKRAWERGWPTGVQVLYFV